MNLDELKKKKQKALVNEISDRVRIVLVHGMPLPDNTSNGERDFNDDVNHDRNVWVLP